MAQYKYNTECGPNAIDYYNENYPRGEYVMVIEGKSLNDQKKEKQKEWLSMSIEEHMEYYESQGVSHKDAMKKVALDRGVQKREIYQALIKKDKKKKKNNMT